MKGTKDVIDSTKTTQEPTPDAVPVEAVVSVTVLLKGKRAEQFTHYMEQERIRIKAAAAEKLLFERLDEWTAAREAAA